MTAKNLGVSIALFHITFSITFLKEIAVIRGNRNKIGYVFLKSKVKIPCKSYLSVFLVSQMALV